jgi:hypothetical protein
MRKALILLALVAVILSSCGVSQGGYRYDHNPNFKGCKQNYRTLNFPR